MDRRQTLIMLQKHKRGILNIPSAVKSSRYSCLLWPEEISCEKMQSCVTASATLKMIHPTLQQSLEGRWMQTVTAVISIGVVWSQKGNLSKPLLWIHYCYSIFQMKLHFLFVLHLRVSTETPQLLEVKVLAAEAQSKAAQSLFKGSTSANKGSELKSNYKSV